MNRYRLKRNLIRLAVAFVLFAVFILTAASFYMLDFALSTERRTHEEAMTRFYNREPKHLKAWVDSLERHHALRDTSVVMEDFGRQEALYIRAAKPTDRVALLVHGYKDRAESMLHIAYVYARLGYNVVLPHCPAHADSQGDAIGMGWTDRLAVMRWIEVADNMFRADKPHTQMVLHGISMGAATVMMISGEQCPPCVKCVVEDCGYTSVWDEFAGEMRAQFDLPPFPLLYTSSALCKIRYGWSFGEASALDAVGRSTLPMLFIHGDDDHFVPFEMLDKLYNAKTQGYKEKYIAQGTKHARAYTDHPEQYTQRVKNFTERFIH